MVSLRDVAESNSRIRAELPSGLVAVFPGATSGIGEATLKHFAQHATRPRVYFIGRSQEAGDRITAECRAINADGEYVFMKSDLSLIKNVDDVCRRIKARERSVNLLFLSIGSLMFGTKTAEDLHFAASLVHHARTRFMVNLLPLLHAAPPTLRRVVSVFAGTKEGRPAASPSTKEIDWQMWDGSPMTARGQFASMVTLTMLKLAQSYPDVSFVHNYPGLVKSGSMRGTTGLLVAGVKAFLAVFGHWLYVPTEEVGEFQTFFATSARFPARERGPVDANNGVGLGRGVEVARGINGSSGGGVYVVDQHGEVAGTDVEEIVAGMMQDGTVQSLWEHTRAEFTRITGVESI